MIHRTTRSTNVAALAGLCVLVGPAFAQSLYDRRPEAPSVNDYGMIVPESTDGTMSVLEASLTAVEPPKPREFEAHDLITIIISERTSIDSEGSVDTSTDYSANATFTAVPDPLKLLQGRYEVFDRLPQELDVAAGHEHSGEGAYERDDTITARVTGRIVEVKPNGTLLIESKTTVKTDGEERVIVLSGLCRQEDVTIANTIQSNQMANLVVQFEHRGEIRKSTEKGWIPKVLEAVFSF
jgi:flagellar L-ring protein precursor FlgH